MPSQFSLVFAINTSGKSNIAEEDQQVECYIVL